MGFIFMINVNSNQLNTQQNPAELGMLVPPKLGAKETLIGVGLFTLTAATRGSDGLINVGLDLRGKLRI